MEDLPGWFTNVWAVVFGLICGSFANVLVARLPKGLSVVKPSSRCPSCLKSIRWFDNIPVLSFLLLKGKCRACGSKISLRYPVIELLCSLLFLAAALRFGWSPVLFVRDWPFVVILVAITFIDLEHRIIPDALSLTGIALGLATAWMLPQVGLIQSAVGALFGFSVFYVLAWLYQKMSGRAGLGGGDIKLLAMLGAFLGPSGVFATIFISSIFGSLAGIAWALASRKKNVMKVAIPYGPFLVVGGLYYYFLGDILWFRFTTPM